MNSYDDIIDLPHHEPHHPRMPMENRAAQFAPFAALSGHDSAIAETARLTDSPIELSEDEQIRLSRRLHYAYSTREMVIIKYFQPDPTKDGGKYMEISARIKKIDETERILYLFGGEKIKIDYIKDITGPLFSPFD